MATKIAEVSSSSKFIWTIENFSNIDLHLVTYSEVFSVGSFQWKSLIYPKENGSECLSLFLFPVGLTRTVYTEFSFAVISQTDPNKTVKQETKYEFPVNCMYASGWPSFMRLSELHAPDKGYLVDDTCIIEVEVTCRIDKESKDDDDRNPNMVAKAQKEKQTNEKDVKSSSESGEYPGAGQPFGEGRHNSKAGLSEDKEFEDVGGFSILKTQAPLYRKIWLKYGHIPSTRVMPISLYPILVMVVKDLMNCILDMHQCRYVELSSKMIKDWEEMIMMAEQNKFNIGWLRERLETVKNGMGGMQNLKTELLEHGQPLRAAKSRIKAAGDELKKAEVQLMAAKDYLRDNISGLLSGSDLEMYLEIGDNLLLEGLF